MASIYTEAALFVDDAEEVNASTEAESEAQNSSATQALLNPKDPCSFCCQQDFIIFSEFSEVLGPLPLLTIPSHVHDSIDLDMNSFILKIMSVDYQANPSSGHFGLAEDAQVLQTPVIPGIHAYVHYFTLYDVHARGFVRPMCLAFVTRDKNKLENRFLELRENFLKITDIMKFDNRQGFVEDIKHTLHCLKTTQEQYFRLKRMEEENKSLSAESFEYLESIDIEQLVNYYAELKNLMHIVEPAIDCDLMDSEMKDWSNMIKNSDLSQAKRLLEKLLKHIPKVMSMSGSKRSRYIRPVICIAPWGCVAAMWKLMHLQRFFSTCSLSVDLNVIHTSFNPDAKTREIYFRGMNLAFEESEFLTLMSNITDPKEWGDQNSIILDNIKDNTSSGSDSNCSFHSAKPSLLGSSSSDSYRDLDRNLSDWSLDEKTESTWSTCLWSEKSSTLEKPGHHILEFFNEYSTAARHLIYSILIGRTVVLAGPKQQKAKTLEMTLALAPLIPGRCSTSILKWHQGILVSSHLDQYKLIGLCVPERLTIHDLINSQDKNRVTILDMSSKQLLGPAYSGTLLSPLMPNTVSLHKNDQSLILLLHAMLSEIDQKVSVCRVAGPLSLSEIGLQGCDLSIVKFLTQLNKNNDFL